MTRLILTLIICGFFITACSNHRTATEAEQVKSTEIAPNAIHQIEITVQLPEDAPQDIYLSGNLPQLGPWRPADFKMQGTGDTRTASIAVPHGYKLEFKVTAGSWEQEGLGPSGTVLPNFTLIADEDKSMSVEIEGFRKDPTELISNWQGSGVLGELVYWQDVKSDKLKESRHVLIWLPPGYDADSDKRYRVIYMHDGQNLFDPRLSYTNEDWGVDEAMMQGVAAGSYEPAIIVGIWNTADRLWEYSPWHSAENYAQFIIEEIMPRVNAEFNVATGAENTFAMGSSMGGLVSYYLVSRYPDYFSACGCLSSHLVWSPQAAAYMRGENPMAEDPTPYIFGDLQSDLQLDPDKSRLFFDYGTEGLDADYGEATKQVQDWLTTQGFEMNKNLKVQEYPGADHSESAWRARVGDQLQWLLGE